MKKNALLVLLSFFCCALVTARSYDDVLASGYIEIAIYNDFPPYSYLDKAGKPVGVDIEIGKAIAEKLNVKPRWFWFNPDENLEDDLRNIIWKGGKINKKIADLMLRVPYDSEFSHAIDGYGLPKNDLVVMFGPYHAEGWIIARNLEKTGQTRNLAAFRSEKVGVELDSLPDFFLTGVYRGSVRENVVHYKNIIAAANDLKNNNIAAVVGMRSQLEWALIDQDDKFDLNDGGLEQLHKRKWDIGMAVRHDFRQLSYAIEEIIEKMVKNGDVKQIFDVEKLSYVSPEFHSESD